MNLPLFLDRKAMAKLAAPDETHCVRVILKNTANPGAYTLSCRLRKYLFERNPVHGHILEIPLSIWMHGASDRPGKPDTSVSADMKPTATMPLTIQVVPWKGATSKRGKTAVELLESIAGRFNAPPALAKAFQLAKTGDLVALEALEVSMTAPAVGVTIEEPAKVEEPAGTVTESPAAARMRKMREAKAAKKQAQLQPA